MYEKGSGVWEEARKPDKDARNIKSTWKRAFCRIQNVGASLVSVLVQFDAGG